MDSRSKMRSNSRRSSRAFAIIGTVIGLSFVLNSPCAWAQGTAQINGTVKDPSGAILPGVEISVTQTDTGVTRSTVSGESGSYVLPNLPIGPYKLEGVLPGFRTYVQNGIVLQVNANALVNIVLEIGQLTDQIEVQADAALVETRSSGVSTVVDNQRVLELPLNGRNVTELVVLAGMASVNTNSGSLNSIRNYPTVVISVAGGLSNGVLYQLDGANNNDPHNNLNLPMPFPDALQEFKVETSALQAQYGLHSAAAVSAVTKSGTNDFHGDVFEFLRNGVFNARNFFAPSRDTLKRNQFGGVLGGPVLRDKLFFFGGYQRTTERSKPSENKAFVPTAAMLAGDFTQFASPACNGRQITLAASQGFVNNQIPVDRLNPAAVKIAKRLPSTSDPCGSVTFGLLNNLDEHLGVARIDYAKSNKHSLFGRLLAAHLTKPSTFDGQDLLTVNTFATDDKVWEGTFGDTYLIGAGIVSSFRASVTRTIIPKIVDHNVGTWNDYGVKASSFLIPVIGVAVTGGFTIGGGNSIVSDLGTGPNYSLSHDFSVVKGTHQLGFGVTYIHTQSTLRSGVQANGTATVTGQTTGLGLADYLVGAVAQWRQGNEAVYDYAQHYLGVYAQDNWKATPRLAVNYGLRWEPSTPIYSKFNQFERFQRDWFEQNLRSTQFLNAPVGVLFPGDSQYRCNKTVECNSWNHFSPRLGLAWDPTGTGSMSVRAAYGLSYDRAQMYGLNGYSQAAPFGNNLLLTNVSLSDPWASYPGGNPLPIPLDKNMTFPQFGAYLTHPPNAKPIYANQWNLSVQGQVGTNWLLTANYVGSSTVHLQSGREINPAVFLGLGACTINGINYPVCSTVGNTNDRRELSLRNRKEGQYYGNIYELDDGGTGNYNALFLSAQKRLSGGTSILANYTWSHCISDFWNAFIRAPQAPGDGPGGRRSERGNCANTDQRHSANFSIVAQSPRFERRALRMMAGNWQLSPILKIRSGQYFTVTTGVDNTLTGLADTRPNQVLANPYLPHKSVDGWLNPKAFAVPAAGTWGNLGANNIIGPGSVQLDLALSRTFRLAEQKTIQLRGEAFNLPNHLNPSNPIAVMTNAASFGKILTDNVSTLSGVVTGNPRIIQIALKVVF